MKWGIRGRVMGDAETHAQWADAAGYSLVKAIVVTVGGTCQQCLRDAKSCRGRRWCPKWKRWRDCDIACDEYWDMLNGLLTEGT